MLQCELAKQEVLNLVTEILTRSFPDRFQLNGATLSNFATGETFDLSQTKRNPMDIVARLLQVTLHVLK